MAAKALPTDVLQDVAYLNDADEEEEQISILSFIVRSQDLKRRQIKRDNNTRKK